MCAFKLSIYLIVFFKELQEFPIIARYQLESSEPEESKGFDLAFFLAGRFRYMNTPSIYT
jgi:hypothetical protein